MRNLLLAGLALVLAPAAGAQDVADGTGPIWADRPDGLDEPGGYARSGSGSSSQWRSSSAAEAIARWD